ncbi:MAG: hypothetical protein QOH35_852 [Acidobacteriaceae bacterium]|jgi:hypothetical protein|nr:hypothetical protein [Acidobacteriaceae bacterium]
MEVENNKSLRGCYSGEDLRGFGVLLGSGRQALSRNPSGCCVASVSSTRADEGFETGCHSHAPRVSNCE